MQRLKQTNNQKNMILCQDNLLKNVFFSACHAVSWCVPLELLMIPVVCAFSCSNCAVLTVKMESIYICSAFAGGSPGGLVECLSYWHTCCGCSEPTDTKGLGRRAVRYAALMCLYALGCSFCFCWHNMLDYPFVTVIYILKERRICCCLCVLQECCSSALCVFVVCSGWLI